MLVTVRDGSTPTNTPPAVQVYTLGGFRVIVNGCVLPDHAWRRKTARQLFKVLLSRTGRRMTRDEVIEMFWPDSDADAAASNLRSTLYAMRHALEPGSQARGLGVVFGDHDSVWLRPDVELWTDADAFELTVAKASQSSDPLPLLEEASRSYVGEYLPDDRYEDWAAERRDALKRSWTNLQFGLARAAEAYSDATAAAQPLERLLKADPCDERAARELMNLLARHDRRADALRIYQRLVQSLRKELDVAPSDQSVAVFRQISAGETSPTPSDSYFRCAYPFPAPRDLVEREEALGLLLRVMADGRSTGRSALVGAPAGIGKSALVGLLVQRAQAQGVLCLAGGCYEERGSVPLGPFHDALVDFLLAQPVDRLRADFGTSIVDLAHVVPELRYQLNLDHGQTRSSDRVDRIRVFGAIHQCLRTLAERGPVLVCLEDLHAADEATLHLYHYLARQTRRLPLVLLGTYRSDEVAPGQPLAQMLTAMARERLAEQVELRPLGRDGTNALATIMLGGSPSDRLADSLFTATGGNPLFVEQLVLALTEGGLLHERAGLFHGKTDLQRTPAIVGEVITQRLLRLTDRCRETLAIAAVLGQAVDHEVLLAAVEPMEEADLLVNLDQAIAASVLQETPTGYAFRHLLLRETVYWTLSAPRRMLLHGRAAEVLERLHGPRADDHAGELARHFSRAGQAAAVRAKALHYGMKAGRRAIELSSYPEALAQYSRAWEIIEREGADADPSIRLEALEGRGWAELELARWLDTANTFQAALGLAGDAIHRARAHGLIAFANVHMGDIPRALADCREGLDELADERDSDTISVRITLQHLIAFIWYLQGHYRDVVDLGHQMLREAAVLEQPRALLLAHSVLAWGHLGQGQARPAREHYQSAVAAAERAGEKVQLASTYEALGAQSYRSGRFADAREELGRALTLYQDSASELRAVNALQHLCRVWVAEGEHVRAEQQLRTALELQKEGQERWAADGHQILGSIHALSADWETAAACFEQALSIRKRVGDVAGIVESTVALGLIDQHTGRWSTALEKYENAKDVADAMDPSPPRVLARRNLGRMHMLIGNGVEGAAELESATALAETMPESLEYAPTLLSAAELRAYEGDLELALCLAQRSLEHARSVEGVIEAHIALAQLCVVINDHARAAVHAADAQGQAERLGYLRLLTQARLVAGHASSIRSVQRAKTFFEAAVQSAEMAQAPYERAAALLALVDHLEQTGTRAEQAVPLRAEARATLQQLGLRPDVIEAGRLFGLLFIANSERRRLARLTG